MATTIINPAQFNSGGGNSIRSAFNTEGYGVSTSFKAYVQGGSIVPATAAFNVIGAGTVGDPLRMSQFSGFTVPSLVTFTPTGGSSAGTATYLEDIQSTDASVGISCSQNATWTYSGGGSGSSVSISSGGVSAIITFYITTDFNPKSASWTVSATSGGVTQYWDVYLEVQGFA